MKKVLLWFLGIFIFLGVVGSFMESEKAGPPTSKTEQEDTDSASDKKVFMSFYSELMDKTATFDATYKPFSIALENKDIFGALKLATKSNNTINSMWSNIDSMKAPKLQDKEARKLLDDGKQKIAASYLYKAKIMSDFIKLSDNVSTKKVAEISNDSDEIAPLLAAGIFAIMASAEKIGIDVKTLQKK